jgi:hypothetical protein
MSGGVHQAGVDIAKLLESKQGGRVLGAFKNIRSGTIDWYTTRGAIPTAKGRVNIGRVASMPVSIIAAGSKKDQLLDRSRVNIHDSHAK